MATAAEGLIGELSALPFPSAGGAAAFPIRGGLASGSVAEREAGERVVQYARGLFCQLAVRRLAYLGATVPHFLGLTTSAANRAAWSAPAPALEAFT